MRQRKQRRDKIARLISWGHWFTFFNIILALAIGTLYIEAADTPSTLLGGFYMLISWLGHFAFLPFITFIILIFPFCLIVPFSRFLKGVATLVAAFGLIALVADALFFRQYGYHLNTYSLSQLALDAETAFAGASFVLLLGMLLVFVVLLVFELALANIAWKRLERLREKHWGAAFSAVFVLCFLASHSIHIWADAVFYTPITKQDDLFPLSYPTTAQTLMSKHGWLAEERSQATDRLLKGTARIDLNYPPQELMCARQGVTRDTLVMVFDSLTVSEQQRILEVLPQLERFTSPLVGQTSVSGGVFELFYGLADIYSEPMAAKQQVPAFWNQFKDYQIRIELSGDLQQFGIDSYLRQPTIESYRDTLTYSLQPELNNTTLEQLAKAIVAGQQVIVTALTNNTSTQTPREVYSLQNVRVPLFHTTNLPFAAQDIALLTDITPTLTQRYMDCAGGVEAFATGKNLFRPQEREFPVMTSFARDLVVYDVDATTVISTDGRVRSFANKTLEEMPNVAPATPVLVDGIKHLQRFSQQNDE
ncbi:DUF3413 domain-containing protein [Pseudidiomarina sp. CB1]|uniref:DUF3413 domain-containing protein n=1 Tax=Pseudidiomarina sp. CB1 TaxID=2972484 RepID=UPI002162E224|nr:DUF3413 domain-containing protein [Pseudidiomarina sp. CB1]